METKQTILDFVEKTENDDCRIIVFVKSRLVAKRLAFKINNDTDFKNQNLESDYLLGHTGKSLPGRPYGLEMSREKQKEIVEAFKLGSISILVATPIAEEGLDIIKCNLVIQYNIAETGKRLQQRAGRARSYNSFLHSIMYREELHFRDTALNELANLNHELEVRRQEKESDRRGV